MSSETDTLSAIREIVKQWEDGQCSPRRAMHFLDSLVAILAAAQAPATSQPSIKPHPDTVRIDWIDRNVGCSLGLHNGRDLDLSAEGIRDVIDRATLAAEQDYK